MISIISSSLSDFEILWEKIFILNFNGENIGKFFIKKSLEENLKNPDI